MSYTIYKFTFHITTCDTATATATVELITLTRNSKFFTLPGTAQLLTLSRATQSLPSCSTLYCQTVHQGLPICSPGTVKLFT